MASHNKKAILNLPFRKFTFSCNLTSKCFPIRDWYQCKGSTCVKNCVHRLTAWKSKCIRFNMIIAKTQSLTIRTPIKIIFDLQPRNRIGIFASYVLRNKSIEIDKAGGIEVLQIEWKHIILGDVNISESFYIQRSNFIVCPWRWSISWHAQNSVYWFCKSLISIYSYLWFNQEIFEALHTNVGCDADKVFIGMASQWDTSIIPFRLFRWCRSTTSITIKLITFTRITCAPFNCQPIWSRVVNHIEYSSACSQDYRPCISKSIDVAFDFYLNITMWWF